MTSRSQPPVEGRPAKTTTPAGLPAAVEVAWGVRQPARSGPKPALALDEIVDEAVRLADRVGLATFSMNKLAARMQTPTMSLYRYVRGKDDLLTLMVNAAYGPIPPQAPSASPWRSGLWFSATSLFDRYRAHPWVLDVRIRGLPLTPNPLQWVDYGLQALDGTGLSSEEQLGALLLLDGHVRSSARLASDLEASGTDDPPVPRFSDVMGGLVDAERYPALAPLVAGGALDATGDPRAARFEFGVACVLDGIEALIRTRAESANG